MTTTQAKPLLKPAIVIGLGGTGNQVVRRMKMFIQNHYGGKPVLLNFLVIDTDQATFDDQNWRDFPALSDLEKVPLYDPQVAFADVTANPRAYPEIHEWLVPGLDISVLDRMRGAEQVRMRGRVALYKSFSFFARRVQAVFRECQQIRTKLDTLSDYDFNIEADPVVYVVSSVCGGQGAGCFIDVAVAIRLLGERFIRLNVVGVLTLPSVYSCRIPGENRERVRANTHAAMKEVDYLMHSIPAAKVKLHFPDPIGRAVTPETSLFDMCYLVDITNQTGGLKNPEEVFDQIATQLFLEIGTPVGARSDSIRVNLDSVSGLQRDRAHNMGRRYSGFSNHTISFSRERIVELAALKSAHSLLHDRLLGRALKSDEIDKAIGDFVARHRIDESATDDLVNFLITAREVADEKITQGWAQDRPDHATFAADLGALMDAFLNRRVGELRAAADQRAQSKLEGNGSARGMLAELDNLADEVARREGSVAARDLLDSLQDRLVTFEQVMRAELADHQSRSRQSWTEAEAARDEVRSLAHQVEQLQVRAERVSLFSRMWRLLGVVVTLGLWRGETPPDEERTRQMQALAFRLQQQRDLFRDRANQTVEHRMAVESREVAAHLYATCVGHIAQLRARIASLSATIEAGARLLHTEMEQRNTAVKRVRFINGNTMRRDVTRDYVDQYFSMHSGRAAAAVMEWLMPPGQLALDSWEARADAQGIRQRFYDLYAEDILRRSDRDSLAEMIQRLHTEGQGGGLTDRIREGLQFCLPFWDIRIPGNQHPTEVLLVGMERDHAAVQHFLDSYTAAQRGQVFAQVVSTAQDSVILISRIAHGAAYYWHAEDEEFFHHYAEALEQNAYPVHLDPEWRTLPEPLPDPTRLERRLFALGIAFEWIAVRGAAYYWDSERTLSLVGTSRQTTPDWTTVPLLEAPAPPASTTAPRAADHQNLIDDDNRTEAMQRFLDSSEWIALLESNLLQHVNAVGRIAMRRQVERYCSEILVPAIEQYSDRDPIAHQLEVERAALEDVIEGLKLPTGLPWHRV